MIIVESAGISDVGRKRKGNEDSLFVDDKTQLYVVADGMGGHLAGEVASRLIVETMSDAMKQSVEELAQKDLDSLDESLSEAANRLKLSIMLANKVVYDSSQSNAEYHGMGSTVSAIYFTDETMIVGNVGDSPIYLIRNGTIEPLYVAHTIMAEFERIAPKGAKMPGEEYKHVLTRAMGTKETVTPDFSESTPLKDDILVISSDGLTDLVSAEEILDKAKDKAPEGACRTLVDLANDRGGVDNITVIVLHIKNVTIGAAPAVEEKKDRVKPAKEKPSEKIKVAVDYDTEDDSHRSFIHEISLEGVFIETREAVTIEEELMLTFSVVNERSTFMVTGKIADRTSKGIWVTFENLSQKQKDTITSLKERI